MNLAGMRRFGIEARVLAAQVLYNEKIGLADQDIYNIIFHGFPGKADLSSIKVHCLICMIHLFRKDAAPELHLQFQLGSLWRWASSALCVDQ